MVKLPRTYNNSSKIIDSFNSFEVNSKKTKLGMINKNDAYFSDQYDNNKELIRLQLLDYSPVLKEDADKYNKNCFHINKILNNFNCPLHHNFHYSSDRKNRNYSVENKVSGFSNEHENHPMDNYKLNDIKDNKNKDFLPHKFNLNLINSGCQTIKMESKQEIGLNCLMNNTICSDTSIQASITKTKKNDLKLKTELLI